MRRSGLKPDPERVREWQQKHRQPLKPGKRKRRAPRPEVVAREIRRRSHGKCVVCQYDGKPRPKKAVHLHHVFPVQDAYFPELAHLASGQVGVCFDHHMAHENASRRIPLGALPECVFRLAAAYSQRAVDYLLSTYPG